MMLRRMILIAVAVTLTFVQEQVFLFLPNIQLTVLLMFVFVSVFTYREMFLYILVYVILDNMFLGGFNVFTIMAMLVAWNLIPLIYNIVLRKTPNELTLAIAAFVFGFVYGWVFVPFVMLQTGIYDPVFYLSYLSTDLWFEMVMAFCGFLTVYWLYQPLVKITRNFIDSQQIQTSKGYK